MNARDTVVLATRTMLASKLRTTLTAIGITIGIAAVILLAGLGNGMQDGLNHNASKTATNIVISTASGNVPGANITRRLTDEDATALRDKSQAPAIAQVVPQFSGGGVVRQGENTTNALVYGSGPGFLATLVQELGVGSVFDEADNRTGARVVVIGQGLVDFLFSGDANRAIGQQVTIGRLPFRVIGVLKRASVGDRLAIMPLRTARSVLLGGINRLTLIGVTATSVAAVPAAIKQINQVLDKQHQIDEPGLRDFVQDATLIRVERTQKYLDYLRIFTLGIAGIALLVGGVGVANIMLVSVHERRREIGIRRAVGAPRSAVVKQLLVESTVIAGFGGVVGVLFGVGVTLLAGVLLPARIPEFGQVTVSIPATAVAFGISLAIGVVAGVLPAWRAARLQPVEALRT
ncbi:MAG TPA: ABC transporter permease [Pseudonocardia sp.]|jgi:putative ABC transport system permease protein